MRTLGHVFLLLLTILAGCSFGRWLTSEQPVSATCRTDCDRRGAVCRWRSDPVVCDVADQRCLTDCRIGLGYKEPMDP